MWLGLTCDSRLLSHRLVSNKQICHHMSINYSLHEVTVFLKKWAAAALLLLWSMILCIILVPNVGEPLRSFSPASTLFLPWGERELPMHNASQRFPLDAHKRLARASNFHVMIVIRICATHFHKESSNDATERRWYCLFRMIVWWPSFRPVYTDSSNVASIIRNHSQCGLSVLVIKDVSVEKVTVVD